MRVPDAKTMQFFRVRAIADYLPKRRGLLRFAEGESFAVIARDSPDWWKGQHKGSIGRFPRDHVVAVDEDGNEIGERPSVGDVSLTASFEPSDWSALRSSMPRHMQDSAMVEQRARSMPTVSSIAPITADSAAKSGRGRASSRKPTRKAR